LRRATSARPLRIHVWKRRSRTPKSHRHRYRARERVPLRQRVGQAPQQRSLRHRGARAQRSSLRR
jgi:hypothetical protein